MKSISTPLVVPGDFLGSIYSRVAGAFTEIYFLEDTLPLKTPAQQEAEKSVDAVAALKDFEDAQAAKAHNKLKALMDMTPAQVQTWVAANVTNLAQAQDAIATLAIAVGVLARRL